MPICFCYRFQNWLKCHNNSKIVRWYFTDLRYSSNVCKTQFVFKSSRLLMFYLKSEQMCRQTTWQFFSAIWWQTHASSLILKWKMIWAKTENDVMVCKLFKLIYFFDIFCEPLNISRLKCYFYGRGCKIILQIKFLFYGGGKIILWDVVVYKCHSSR